MAEAKWSGVLSTTEPRNDIGILNVRQGNLNSETVEFQIFQNNKPYDLTGTKVNFCANFGLSAVQKSATVKDAVKGIITFVFNDQSMQAIGRQMAYFQITKDEITIDSTQDFEFRIESSILSRKMEAGSYIESFEKVLETLGDNAALGLAKKIDENSEEVNAQLAQKATKGEITSVDLSVASDSDKLKLINFSEEVHAALSGTAPVSPVIPNGGITSEKYANESILGKHLQSSITPVVKTQSSYVTNAPIGSLYIIPVVLLRGAIDVTFTSNAASSGFLYVVSKRVGINTFDIIQKVAVEVKAGENNISTDLVAEGNGNEYIAFWSIPMKFTSSNGPGFYERATYDGAFTPINAVANLINSVDFSLYISYKDIALVSKTIRERQNIQEKITAIDNKFQYMLADYVSETVHKNFDLYSTVGAYKLYIPNVALKRGSVFVHHKTDRNETGYFYIFEKTGDSFLVKKRVQVDLLNGANIVDMNYRSIESGNEYVGFYAHNFYRTSGGTGMFESDTPLHAEGQTVNATSNPSGTSSTFDFATYYEYRGNELGKDILALKEAVDELKNGSSGETGTKLNRFSLLKYSQVTTPVGFVGRWFDKTIDGVVCKTTINAGSELYFKVKGSLEASINFKINTALHTPYYAFSIDGEPLVRRLITSPIITLPDKGEHIVRVVVDGLTESENKWDGEKGVALAGVTTPTEGTITGVLPRNILIEYIGDSITEGVRVLSSTENNANGNSASGAFPFITSQLLNAVSYRVGFGATGATQAGSGGVPKCIDYIDNMTLRREAPYYEPGAIVINHGTNDSSATSAVFKVEFNKILERLKVKYSGTPIFVMIPFNQRHAQDIRECVKTRPYVTLVETAGWGVTFSDGVHPDVPGGIIAGSKLAGVMEGTLGKAFFL